MNIGIIVYSRTGHTLSVAQTLKEGMSVAGHEVMLDQVETAGPVSLSATRAELKTKPDVDEFEAVVFGSPVQGGVPAAPVMSYLEQVASLEGKQVACFVTGVLPAGWGRNQALAKMKEICESKGATVCGSESVGWLSFGRRRKISKLVDSLSRLF